MSTKGGFTVFHAGDQIENPVTGERIVFHETSSENGGKRVVFETIVQPGGFVASAHVHPFQTECFEVVSGTLGMRRGKDKLELHAGEDVIVEQGTPHKFWNAGEDEVRFLCTVTPALQFERLIATMYTLAADGKTNKKGMPNPLRLAVIAKHHFDDVRLPKIPHALQKLGLVMGAPAGRILGYGPTYEPAAGSPSATRFSGRATAASPPSLAASGEPSPAI
jgi:mannose-6-phosphate isomerase-like protein (cupin superfamily)